MKQLSKIFLLASFTSSLLFIPRTYAAMELLNDSCYATYHKTLGGNKQEMSWKVIETTDSNYVIAGYTRSYGAGAFDGLIQKINRDGSIAWSSVIGGSGNDYFYYIIQTADGGFLAAGNTQSFGGGSAWGNAWLVKIDSAGNLLWAKTYDDNSTNGSIFYSVVQTNDGGYAAGGSSNYAPSVAEMLVVKIDSDGNTEWAKIFDSGSTDFATGITVSNDTILVSGCARGGYNYYDGIFMALRQSNGHLFWGRRFDIESGNNWFGEILKSGSNYFIRNETTDDWSDNHPRSVIVKVDHAGMPLSLTELQSQHYRELGGMHATADGGVIVDEIDLVSSGANTINDSADVHLCKINSAGNSEWNKVVFGLGAQYLSSVVQTTDGSYVFIGYNNQVQSIADSADLLLVKVDSAGLIPECINETVAPALITPFYTFDGNFDWITKHSIALPATDASVMQEFDDWNEHIVCYSCKPDISTLSTEFLINDLQLTVAPNPFSTSAGIQFSLPKNAAVEIYVLDLAGRKIKTIAKGNFESGPHMLPFPTEGLLKGIYLLQMASELGVQNKKIVIQ